MAETDNESRPVDTERQRDAELVVRLRTGDARALDELFERHREAVYVIAYRVLGSAADARDAVAEVFLHAMRGLEAMRDATAFRPWLHRIAVHAALDYRRWRRAQASAKSESDAAGATGRPAAADDEAADHLDRAIDEALENVSEKNRAALILFAMKGATYAEVAEVLGISTGAVMSRLFNARQRLRGLLAAEIG